MYKLELHIQAETKEQLLTHFEELFNQAKNGDDFLGVGTYSNGGSGDIINTEEMKKVFEEQAGYELSDNQVQFCMDAEHEGLDIDFTYSGRAMYGKTCPSVVVENTNELPTKSNYKTDSMGYDTVMYARS